MLGFAARRKRTPEQWAYEKCTGPALLWITKPFKMECNNFTRFDLSEKDVEMIKMVLPGGFPIWMNTVRVTDIKITHSYWRKEIHSRLTSEEKDRVLTFLLCILRPNIPLGIDVFWPIMWFHALSTPALLEVRPENKKRFEESSWKHQTAPDRLELLD